MRIKSIKIVIMEHFFDFPGKKLRVRGIERELSLPLPSVIRYCKELVKEGILGEEKIGNVTFYKAGRGSERFILEKKLYNIRKLYASGLIGYIKQELSNPGVVVFGSFAKGEDTEESDIDLFVETKSKKEIDVKRYEKLLKRNVHIIRNESIKKVSNPHLANNIINGVTVNHYIEVFG